MRRPQENSGQLEMIPVHSMCCDSELELLIFYVDSFLW